MAAASAAFLGASEAALAEDWVIEDGAGAAPVAGLGLEAAVESEVVASHAHEIDAVLSVVSAPQAGGASPRAPLRLVAVLDKSGSMHGEKLRLVRDTMRFMLRHLDARDRLGLVEYGTAVKVLAPLTLCDEAGRARLDAALGSMRAGSQTNLSGGLLRGLELHGEVGRGVAQAVPHQRVRFGNTYRLLSDDEAESLTPWGTTPLQPGVRRVHEWTMELRFDDEEDAALVEKVTYRLHETFTQNVVLVSEAPFSLKRHGWGTFRVFATLHLCDGRAFDLEHDLVFGEPETFRPMLLPLRRAVSPALVDPPADSAAVRSTFLFTDGLANVGIRDPEALCAAARAKLEELGGQRCTLSTFGFGSDHSANLLERLASAGGGTYSYVESEDQIGEAFGEALGGLLSTTHQNVRLRLTLAPGVRVARACTDFETAVQEAEDGAQSLTVELGDLFDEERRDILLRLALPAAGGAAEEVLGRARASGFSLHGLRSEDTPEVALRIRRGEAPGAREPLVERHRNRFVTTEALKLARRAADRGQIAEARRLLSEAAGALGASSLAVSGDEVTLALIADINDCMRDLQDTTSYEKLASKKMAGLWQGHTKQRCTNMETTEVYANPTVKYNKAVFAQHTKSAPSQEP